MINFVLVVFTSAVFYGGFSAGRRFKTFKEMCSHGVSKFKD